MKLQKENKFKKIILPTLNKLAIIGGISILGFSFFPSMMKIIDINTTSKNQNEIITQSINSEYKLTTNEENHIDKYNFQQLKKTNPNIVAIIEGSCFDGGYYPIVSTSNNDEMNYYLTHSIDNTNSSLGSLFTDCNNDIKDQIIRIWGHNFNNQSGKMFTKLANICQNQEQYDQTIGQDQTLKLYTEEGEYDLDVFSCVVNDPRTQNLGTYNNQDDFLSEMNNIINNSLINTNNYIEKNDQVIILTTCTNLGSSKDPNNRISIYCKKTKTKEKTINYGKTL